MLGTIGKIVENKPWIVVGIILMITVGFALLLPSLEMQTSMEHFLPEDEIVQAQDRINDYFGAGYEVIMVYVEKDQAKNVLSADALKEIFFVGKKLEKFDEIEGIISAAYFVDNICQMEFGKSLENCSNEEISIAFTDLMSENKNPNIIKISQEDPNEELDLIPSSRLLRSKSIDSIDIKSYSIDEQADTYKFSIEVYDLSDFESGLIPPDLRLNVIEWFIEFKNLIMPDPALNFEYTLSAHVEPEEVIWEFGKGPLKNFKDIIIKIRNKNLFKSYKKEAFLWINAPGQLISFPIKLESANITFDTKFNKINIFVNKHELGNYGIAPQIEGMALPGKISNTMAGFRYYQLPGLKLPWLRNSFNISFLMNFFEKLQNQPLLSVFSEKILNRFINFSWEDFDDIFSMMEQGDFDIGSISLKDIANSWVVTDLAPDEKFDSNVLFIKPAFIDVMKDNVISFLSEEYPDNIDDCTLLLMVQVDGSLSTNDLNSVSNEIVVRLKELDSESDYVIMGATGSSVVESEINDTVMDANSVVIPLIFIVISIILFISFWKLSYIFLPLFGLTCAIIWLFGTMVLLRMDFMIIEVALIPMLMGLGVDYSVHMFHNYRSELSKGKTPGQAIFASIMDIGMAMFLATITTFIAFLSFLTATMIPLRDFGVLCGIGITYIFIITITLEASLRYILDRRKKVANKLKLKKDTTGKIMRKIAKIVCKHPMAILILTVFITIVMVIGALNIKTGFAMEDFLPEENPSVKVLNEISEKFPMSSQEQEHILIEGNVARVEILKDISQTIDNLHDDKYIMLTNDNEPKTNSILTVINKAINQNSTLISEFNIDTSGVPKTDNDVVNLFNYLYNDEAFNYEITSVLHEKNGVYDATIINIYTSVMSSNEDDINKVMDVMYNDLLDDITDFDTNTDAIVTGDNSMMYVIMNSMTESQILSTAVSIVLAGIVLILAYRKPILGLITMIPVLVSTVWIVGTMHFIGYSLNVMTIMITSLTIGLGVTYAIHAVERFRIIADRTGNIINAVSETIGHTGGALLIAAVTTIFGFGMLIIVPMPIEQQFGLITALTILYAFITSIFILPPVLMMWGKWRKNKKGFIISPGKPKNN